MYKRPGELCTEIRILTIHEAETGWFFTVHRNDQLLFQSPTDGDRVKILTDGIGYLDTLLKIGTN